MFLIKNKKILPVNFVHVSKLGEDKRGHIGWILI